MIGRARVVVRREFLGTVKRPGWLIVTFGMPVFLLLYGAIAMIPGLLIARTQAKGPPAVGVVDGAGILPERLEEAADDADLPGEARRALELGRKGAGPAAAMIENLTRPVSFVRFETEDAGKEALLAEKIATLYVVPGDYLETGSVRAFFATTNPLEEKPRGESALRRLLVRGIVGDRVAAGELDRVVKAPKIERYSRQKDGGWERRGLDTILRSFLVPFGGMMLLFVAILMNSAALLQGLGEEKESRVLEVILSSVDARSFLLGKLLGLGAAGLLQLTVWLAMAIVPALALVAGFSLGPGVVLTCLAFFAGGFLLFGTLMMATGSLGTTAQESQQLGMFWVIASILPLMFFPVMIAEPNGTAARVLSWIPLTSPMAMMMRMGSGEVPLWDLLLSLVLLAAGIWLALRFAAKVFRVALLLYGKRPTLPEIWRLLRA